MSDWPIRFDVVFGQRVLQHMFFRLWWAAVGRTRSVVTALLTARGEWGSVGQLLGASQCVLVFTRYFFATGIVLRMTVQNEVRALLQVSHREFVRKELRALAARLEAQLPRPAEVASAPAAAPPSPWAFAGASLAAEEERTKHKLKRMIQTPNSFFMDVKCPGCLQITTVYSHAQTVVLCGNCNVMLCQPTGGLTRLTEGCSFRKKAD
ncbi:unnamed protein product [Prorocentrum cordatum]|uniref:40S ribosomal protein S27 n=1 Tax=Prorocentrum cordatum TaxID=2364126 RepID=A0ABN9UZ96_9DINO|nr:unnamed protein product [Polarella glacialis]